MKIGVRTAIVQLLLILGVSCGSEEPPASIGPSNFLRPGEIQIRRLSGSVLDTVGRPISGALVQILASGESARHARPRTLELSTMTGSDGSFVLMGPFNRSETVQVTREGYVTATQTRTCEKVSCFVLMAFWLEGPVSSVDISGDYTLTLSADSTCPDLPGEARTRTYTASMTPDTPPTRYRIELGGAALYEDVFVNFFSAGIAGDYFAFPVVYPEPSYAGYLPGLVEEIGPNTYVGLSGVATATVAPAASVISAVFDGWITYCALKSPLVSGYAFGCDDPSLRADPTPSRPVTYARCESKSHRMVLTRR